MKYTHGIGSLTKEFNTVVDEGNDADKDQVHGQIHVEQAFACAVLGADQEQILDKDDEHEHWHLVLDTLIDEAHVVDTL